MCIGYLRRKLSTAKLIKKPHYLATNFVVAKIERFYSIQIVLSLVQHIQCDIVLVKVAKRASFVGFFAQMGMSTMVAFPYHFLAGRV